MNSRRRRASLGCHFIGAVVTGLAVNGCAVGPNFRHPDAPRATAYVQEPLPAATAGVAGADPAAGSAAQRLVAGMDIPGQWWTLFRSPALDDLVKEALQRNPTVQSAQASLRQAKENEAAQRGTYFPAVQAGYSFTRQRNATDTLSPTLTSGEAIFNLHTAQISVTYLLDVFGGNRRQVESLAALAEAQRHQLQATYLTLSSNVVTAAIQEASLRAQIAATEEIIGAEREVLRILGRQQELGSVPMTDVLAQEAIVANSEATLPPLRKVLAQQRHQIAALLGRLPADEPQQRFELAAVNLPQEIPLGVPSALVRQRPDVLAAEAQLHAATANVGVAVANLLPQITLSAMQGGASTVLNELLVSGNTFWSLGATLTQTLFEGGTLLHRKRAAEAALDQAGAQYRTVVIAAFQEVADALTALQFDADALNASLRAQRAAGSTLAAIRRNVEIGSASHLALLNAQQTYQQAVLNAVQARASRLADTAALLAALGGGWWNRGG